MPAIVRAPSVLLTRATASRPSPLSSGVPDLEPAAPPAPARPSPGPLSHPPDRGPRPAPDLRLGLELLQQVLRVGRLRGAAGRQRQPGLAGGAAAPAQAPRQGAAPGGGALVEGAPEQRHRHPGERRDRGGGAELREHQDAPPRRAAAPRAGAARAAAGQQAPGARVEHEAQQEEGERGHQQEDQAVGQVPGGAAGTLEYRGGEHALAARRQEGHQAVAQRAVMLEVQVQHRPELIHGPPAPAGAVHRPLGVCLFGALLLQRFGWAEV